MSLVNGNRYQWQDRSRSYDGSYSDNNSIHSQEHNFENSENNLFYLGQNHHYLGDFDERSGSFCSTCPSEDYSDSEDEDAAEKWPWIADIQENGDLMYVQSHQQHKHHNHKPRSKSFNNQNNKERGIQGKLKNVIKKSRSFTKKDSIDRNVDISKYKLSTEKKEELNLIDTTAEIHTITNDGVRLVCKNVLIYLHEKVQESFANLENVIGVISGLDLDPVLDDFEDNILLNGNYAPYNSNVIVVQGIIPNSPAGGSEISIGDIILAINGIKVNLHTVNSIIEKINGAREIVVTIERVATVVEPDKPSELCSIISNTLVEADRKNVFNAFNETCVITYLTLNANEDDVDGDILFWYPDSEKSKVLRNIRGIFLTLGDMMVDVLGENAESSIFYTSDERINVCYKKNHGNVLVVAVPDVMCGMNNLMLHFKEFVKLLVLLKGDLTSAFSEENLPYTKHEATLFMDLLLLKKSHVPFGTIRQLQLSVKNNIDISNVLSDAEAADYGECVDDFFPHQRLYGTIGTCLFYKENLVCSHLTEEDFQDVVTFCRYHWLFMLAEAEKMKKLVVWKEIFLSGTYDTIKETEEFQRPQNARWFILVVGQSHSLFCTLLETGGAASIPDGNPGPHPYYVDTAWSILNYLNENMGFENVCNTRLSGPSMPAIVHPSEALNPKISASPRAIELIKRKIPVPRPETDDLTINQALNGDPDTTMIRERSQSRMSNLSTSSGRTYNGHLSAHESPAHMKTISMVSQPEFSSNAALSTKLTTGLFNTLFYFTVLSNLNGVFICPNSSKSSDKLTSEILEHYTLSCEKMHKWFNKEQECTSSKPLEYGVLFDLRLTKGAEMKKGFPNVRYWVVGRVVEKKGKSEEIYVCFQEGTPQNVIEMAFKIRFGCYY